VGRLSVQIAKHLGAGHVVAAARNRERLEALLDHGADEIVVLGGDDDEAALRAAAPGPYDVVIDMVFGEAFEAALPTTNLGDPEIEGVGGGRYIVVGQFDPTRDVTVPIHSFFGLTIKGHQNSAVPREEKLEVFDELTSMAMSGDLWIEIERVPIEDISEAWERVGESAHVKMTVVP
jgi:NADPH:quinone reductase-like Zn-dependent oxidoreductase